jgi:hypothetical protein
MDLTTMNVDEANKTLDERVKQLRKLGAAARNELFVLTEEISDIVHGAIVHYPTEVDAIQMLLAFDGRRYQIVIPLPHPFENNEKRFENYFRWWPLENSRTQIHFRFASRIYNDERDMGIEDKVRLVWNTARNCFPVNELELSPQVIRRLRLVKAKKYSPVFRFKTKDSIELYGDAESAVLNYLNFRKFEGLRYEELPFILRRFRYGREVEKHFDDGRFLYISTDDSFKVKRDSGVKISGLLAICCDNDAVLYEFLDYQVPQDIRERILGSGSRRAQRKKFRAYKKNMPVRSHLLGDEPFESHIADTSIISFGDVLGDGLMRCFHFVNSAWVSYRAAYSEHVYFMHWNDPTLESPGRVGKLLRQAGFFMKYPSILRHKYKLRADHDDAAIDRLVAFASIFNHLQNPQEGIKIYKGNEVIERLK